jgi:hypothetical protein
VLLSAEVNEMGVLTSLMLLTTLAVSPTETVWCLKTIDTLVVLEPTVVITSVPPLGSNDAEMYAGVSALLTDVKRATIAEITPLVKKFASFSAATGVHTTLSVT